jgi:phage terminase small subunit
MTKPVSLETRQRQSRAQLSLKQQRFVKEYAHLGNATEAARRAGYKQTNSISQIAHENLRKPLVASAIRAEIQRIDAEVTPQRVKNRLHDISHAAQEVGQFGPAVRAEELLGKSIGMWIDQSLNVTANISGDHLQALLEVARKRQQEPIDLADDAAANSTKLDD